MEARRIRCTTGRGSLKGPDALFKAVSRIQSQIHCTTRAHDVPNFPVSVNSLFFPNGIFIWWPPIEPDINATSLVLQFWHNSTIGLTNFSEHIVGTTKPITGFQSARDVEGLLEKLSAVTNVYFHSANKVRKKNESISNDSIHEYQNGTITEVRVSRNVAGILIPNSVSIVVRVLVPIIDNGAELVQDMRYVEWNTVSFL